MVNIKIFLKSFKSDSQQNPVFFLILKIPPAREARQRVFVNTILCNFAIKIPHKIKEKIPKLA
jgi:hypothetical protein